jgi:hypothetical protein
MSEEVTFEPIPAGEPAEINIGGPAPEPAPAPVPAAEPAPADIPPADTPSADAPPADTDSTFDPTEYVRTATEGRFSSLDELLELVDQDAPEPSFKDDFIKSAVEYYEKTGTLKPFLEAMQTDYDALEPMELMRHKLRQEYSDLSNSAFEKLFRREVVDKYNLDEDQYEEEDVELGKQLLKKDAESLRQQLKSEQSKFLEPENDGQDDSLQLAEEWANRVSQDQLTQQLLETKAVTIEVDGEEFNYEIDNPQAVMDMTVDNSKFFNLFLNEGGEVDLAKWYKVVAFALEPDVYERSLLNHGKTVGVGDVERTLKNPETPVSASKAPQAAQDWTQAFLDAALNQKRK